MGRFPCRGLCCTETKSLKLKYGTNFKKQNTTHGARTHLSFSAVPSVSVESILQRECERSVRDVGVGSAKAGYSPLTATVWPNKHVFIISNHYGIRS